MVYLISNAGELLWLQEFVNSGMAGDCSAKLMADINLNEGVIFNSDGTYTSFVEGATLRKWTPIDNMYGDFDGNGHTISGIYCVSEYDNVGLFGYDVSWNITNLTIANSYFEGNNNVGAISGYSENASYEGCVVKEDVTVKGNDYVGGISGYLSSSGQTANCMSLATIICTDGVYGGFAGSNSSAISNCYTTNEIFVGLHSTYYGNEFANCYYVSDIENETYKGLSSISASAVTSGELAYRIQAGVKGEEIYDEESGEYVTAEPKQIWGQKLGEDKYPVLGGDKLYYGYKDCNATEMAYYNNNNNNLYDEIPAHSFENGKCTICGEDVKLVSIKGDIALPLKEIKNNVYKGVVALKAGKYRFNVDVNGKKLGLSYVYTNTATIDYSAGFTAPSQLLATGGKYTFTYNSLKKVLKIEHEPVEALGDVNGDGNTSVSDVIFVMKHIVGETALDKDERIRADMNSDGKITLVDVLNIQKMILDMV